jgi:hypothetical protein
METTEINFLEWSGINTGIIIVVALGETVLTMFVVV